VNGITIAFLHKTDRLIVTYQPKPIDTSAVQLPKGLAELTELLARNTHENWALQRIEDGWQYGEVRDDRTKSHPNLVPYEELSESDRDYDRITSLETLRVILALGFTIEKADE